MQLELLGILFGVDFAIIGKTLNYRSSTAQLTCRVIAIWLPRVPQQRPFPFQSAGKEKPCSRVENDCIEKLLCSHTQRSGNLPSKTYFFGLSGVVTKIYSAMSFNGLSVFSPFSTFSITRPASWNSFWISRTLLRFLCPRCNDFFFVYAPGLSLSWMFASFRVRFGFSVDADFFLGRRKDLTACQSVRECLKLTFFRRIPAAPFSWGASLGRPATKGQDRLFKCH